MHLSLRVLSAVNGSLAALWLSPRYHEALLGTAAGGFLFAWLSLSALVLPLYLLWGVWRLATRTEREAEFRLERARLVIDGVCVCCFTVAWIAMPPIGYFW
jgi:hypothetical protein